MSRAVMHRIGKHGRTLCARLLGEVSGASTDSSEVTCKACKRADPLAGIPPELQAKMRDPAWRAAFNAPLTPDLAARVMPPVDVLALMLARWMKISQEPRRGLTEHMRRRSRVMPPTPDARAEGATADLLEALEGVIAAANAQPGDGVKGGAR